MSLPLPTQAVIARQIDGLRRRLRRWLWLAGLSRVLLALAAVLALSFAADRTFRMDRAQRAVSLALAAGILGYAVHRWLVRPLRTQLTDDALCRRVEQRHPELADSLISALQLGRVPDATTLGYSADFVAATVAAGTERSAGFDFGEVLDRRRQRQHLWIVAAVLATLVALGALFAGPLSLWARRNLLLQTVAWPQRTRLVVEGLRDGRLRVPRGDDLELRVAAHGIVPSAVTVAYRVTGHGGGSDTALQVGPRGFQWKYANVFAPMKLRVSGGDAATEWIPVELAERPMVAGLELAAELPAYTGQGRRVLPAGESSYPVLRGSALEVAGTATKPLATAALVWANHPPMPCAIRDGTNFQVRLPATALTNTAYQIELTDTEGLAAKQLTRFTLRVLDDARPLVRARLAGIGQMITTRAVVPLTGQLTDDYAVAAGWLTWQTGGTAKDDATPAEPRTGTAALTPTNGWGHREIEVAHRLDTAPIRLLVDSYLALQVHAQDNDSVTGPKTNASAAITLRVVTDETLREELIRREQEQRQTFEQIIGQQRQLLVDTRRLLAEPDAMLLRETEKQQRLLGKRCENIASQFAQVLAEIENNKLEEGSAAARSRIQGGIVDPLGRLTGQAIPAAARQLERATTATTPREALAPAAADQQEILAAMQTILQNMARWESFQQIVNLIRDIHSTQKSLQDQTGKELERKIRGLLEPTPTPPKP